MKRFNTLNVGTRLAIGFILMIILVGLVGLLGLMNMSRMDEISDLMYERELLGLAEIKQMNIQMLYLDRAEKNLLLSSSREDKQFYEQQVQEYRARIQEQLDRASEKFVTTDAQEAIQEVESALGPYLNVNSSILSLAASDAIQESRDSVTLSQTQGREVSDALDQALTAAETLKETQAQDFSLEANRLYAQSALIMGILVAASVAVGILLGWESPRD